MRWYWRKGEGISAFLVEVLTHVSNESGRKVSCIEIGYDIIQQVVVIIEVAIRQGLLFTRLWIEVVVDSLQIHIACYSWQETEFQTTPSELSYNLILIIIDNRIIVFPPYAHHVKVDYHI